MTTATDIANRALDILKEAPITSLTDDRPIARWLNRNFSVTRDALLERWEWNFAIERKEIAADAEAPAFGWDYAYTIPTGWLRVIPLTECGTREGRRVPHEIEGGKILTNLSGPLKVRGVKRNENYGLWPSSLQQALSASLAVKMAHWLTGKTSYVQIAEGFFREAMNLAWASDAVQASDGEDNWTDYR